MRKANEAKTLSVLSVAIFFRVLKPFLSVLFFAISIFFISDGTKEIYTITFFKNDFFWKKSRFHLGSLLKNEGLFCDVTFTHVCLGLAVL